MNDHEESVFAEALAKSDPQERAAFLDRACSGNAALRASVESLLAAYDAGSFLESPAAKPTPPDQPNREGTGATEAEDSDPADVRASLTFLTPSAKPDSLGRLGHYEVLEVIGRGGMGIVLRAFDEELHRVVAIKVMAQQLATSATARKRFKREAQAVAAVIHDHIVTIHAVEEANGLPYLVMHCVAGLSLQQRLDRDGPLELQEILRIGMQTASGLAAAHAQGLVHRDIKPANILLENGVERVKITDFGLARAAADANLTQSGMVAGTPQYMSPEQAEGKTVDPRTDLFSLGSVLYAMCTGRAPSCASGSMAVLKRVCEETPTPIRETNPGLPDWLIEIIGKLHAKDPAQRYQSATEVAELLGRHLAHVQHPSVVGQASNMPAETKAGSRPSTRRRLAAAVLICLVAGLSLSEATGVTNLRATVIRIFTPEGTLLVETDDPAVKAKDDHGVTVLPKTEKGVFVLLAVGKEAKFDTLPEAVQGASDGDTIEIRGNGPFVSEPIDLRSTSLVIRAGEGFRPVIKMSPDAAAKSGRPVIETSGRLVLEGLDIQRPARETVKPGHLSDCAVLTRGASLHVANCRFLLKGEGPCIWTENSSVCVARNCEFLGEISAMGGFIPDGAGRTMDNCLNIGLFAVGVICSRSGPSNLSIHLTRNTVVARWTSIGCPLEALPNLAKDEQGPRPVRLVASANIFDSDSVLNLYQHPVFLAKEKALPPEEVEAMLQRLFDWHGRQNLYRGADFRLSSNIGGVPQKHGPKNLEDWRRFWRTVEADSIEGRVRYQGGDLLGKLERTPEQLTPEDFRLRPDSVGYQAGKDKKDLGADVDLVGPGKAYERWKKTPEYQQWIKEMGQIKK